ncbi:MAG: diguanylate cyclase and metal dependent phosphohydrolase, partial [Frankiales bacterium]|nr:diguanylate cyclase and metal dependent phosphohydrolase [Frankiales bacterium]
GRSEALAGCGAVPSPSSAGPCRDALERVRAGRPADGGPSCAVEPVLVEGYTWGAVVVVDPATDRSTALASLADLATFVSMVVVNTEQQRALHDAARTDALTGTANRRAFDERLTVELERSLRHGTPLTLALLDVDRFKQVNDEHGHAVGDRVLVELCRRTQPGLRSIDLLARVGGDEWALLLPETDAAEAEAALERVRDRVGAEPLGGIAVTVTVGAAVTRPERSSASSLYRAADDALYAAKAAGRDRVAVV